MKKYVLAAAAVIAALSFSSCNTSNQSAYRKAYEKAKAQDMAQQQMQSPAAQQQTPYVEAPQQNDNPVVTPLEEAPAQRVVTDNNDNIPVRSEALTVVSGSGLKAYSVVVGSFGVRANAESLQSRLKAAGYDAQVAKNEERNMYRVIISTFDSKVSATDSRNSVRSNYPDAWLLMKK